MASLLSSLGAGLLLTVTLLIAYSYIQDWRRNPARLPYPPGPKGYPIIGNLFDIPNAFIYKRFKQMSRELGTFSMCWSLLLDADELHWPQIPTSSTCRSLVFISSCATAKVLQMTFSTSDRPYIQTGKVTSSLPLYAHKSRIDPGRGCR
jgi:hypothetical protein